MRILVHGAGAVGGTLAGGLADAGHQVTAIARGAHAAAIAASGLVVVSPTGRRSYALPVARRAADTDAAACDAVLLCVKSQDTAGALDDLHRAGYGSVPLVCAQNGVTNERAAAERFEHVYGMMVWTPAAHLEPGVVTVHASEPAAILRLGRFPAGVDDLARELASALRAGGCDARAVADIDAWKHRKLLLNLGNALDAFCLPVARDHPFRRRLEREGEAVLEAAGLPVLPAEELQRETSSMRMVRVAGKKRAGGSTWQSAARGLDNEVEYLNGYVSRLGARLGLATPANDALVELARSRPRPRSVDVESLLPAS